MQNILHKAIISDLERTNYFLHKQTFSVKHKLIYPITDSELVIIKNEKKNYFDFDLNLKNELTTEFFNFKELGFNEDFEIVSDKQNFIIPSKSISQINSSTFGSFVKLKGEFTVIHSKEFDRFKKSHFRLIIEVHETHLTTIFSGEGYKCDDNIYGHGLTKLNIEDKEYHVFRCKKGEKNYLIIECCDKTEFIKFKNVCDLVLRVIGFLTGNWYQEEYFIFSDYAFNSSHERPFYFESLEKSVKTNREIINPSEYKEFLKASERKESLLTDHFFPASIFSKLIESLLIKTELERAIELLIEGKASSSAIIRCSIFYVALETVTSLIEKENKQFFEPINNKAVLEPIKKKMQAIVDETKTEFSKLEYEVLSKKIMYLNTPFNQDKMLRAFELYKIGLTKRLLNILNNRNQFFHGKTPYSENLIKTKTKELNADADRINMLVSILILSYVGYKGHIKNYAGYGLATERSYNEMVENTIGPVESIYYKI